MATVIVLLLLSLSGCREDTPAPPPPKAGPCDYATSSSDEELGGPLEAPTSTATYEQVRIRPGQLQDAYVIQLVNTGKAPVVLDRVELVPEQDAAALNFDGAFVAPSGSLQEIVAVSDTKLDPVKGYCLPPLKDGAQTPILVLRVGPALAADTNGFEFSRNNSVNLHYRTEDGQRYDAVYLVRIEYPNYSADRSTTE